MAERVVVAVVGAGGWGKNHVRNFALMPEVELRYVCERDDESRAKIAELYPDVRAVASLDAVLADADVQGVVVVTDAKNHFDVANAALMAGKDVFVEKPLTLSAESSEALCTLAETGQRILMVGHLLLFHPAVLALKEFIDAGELGDVRYIYTQRLNLGVVRRDENAWWSLAPHDLSLTNFLLDAEPTHVSSNGGVWLQADSGVEDVVFASLEYPGGRMAHVHVSWLDPHKTRRLTVVGSKKMAVFDDTSPDQKLVLFDKGALADSSISYDAGVRVRTGDIRIPALKMVEPLRRECEAFISAIQTRTAPAANGRSGLGVVRILEAGSRSLATHGSRFEIAELV